MPIDLPDVPTARPGIEAVAAVLRPYVPATETTLAIPAATLNDPFARLYSDDRAHVELLRQVIDQLRAGLIDVDGAIEALALTGGGSVVDGVSAQQLADALETRYVKPFAGIPTSDLAADARGILAGAVELDGTGRLPREILPEDIGATPPADSITITQFAPALREQVQSGGVADASLTPAKLAPVLAGRVEVPRFVPQDQTTVLGLPTAYVRDTSPTITKAQTGLTTIYWPYLVKVPASVYAAFPQYGRWRLYFSTDHDTGSGGVGMMKTDALLPGSPDTTWTSVKNGTSSKILVGGSTNQMETPTVIYNPVTAKWHAYVQIETAQREGVTPQSTALYLSDDGVTGWTKVAGGGIPNPGSDWLGWRHTGYAKVWLIDGLWVAWHLSGGGDQSTYGWSYSNDGFSWVLDRRRILTAAKFGGGLQRLGVSTLLNYRGRLWAMGLLVSYSSGAVATDPSARRAWAAPMADDLLSPAGRAQELPFVFDAGIPTIRGLGANVATADDGSLWSAYRTGDANSSFRFMEVK